ncbi:YifB family Mg chelatase-like AAA ATPase [Corynebacterium amycolatum]|uniref:YifB family Mg chelatase-like AAA ATPase n=1 Tax=Corynebacterium amycolatum TaxID=43765 RepID=A0AAW9SQS9_CORAY|nr:YifB family Mg chelatase-like AAA ATPase [Corynebacterium amycolatum]MDK7237354.1 YifB family Mg chelatase-like AAA ATPase [Corynebacterium amycolatum]MDK7247163.1 YifB family Mg chelatase-like AAA ATPase [Corynebacterium amycolatum]
MTVGTALAVSLSGIEGTIVQVEADVGRGLPGMYIGGLGDAAVGEAKHRVRTAVANSQLPWPKTKVVVSLSPAHIRKHGTSFDLAIVCAILIATRDDMEARGRLRHTVLIGELGLDGSIRPVRGVLPQVLAAREAGARWVVVPAANAAEAALVDGIAVCTAADLTQLWGWVLTGSGLTPALNDVPSEQAFSVDLADVDGQPEARFALEVAAAGGHNLFMQGSPGTGKSMLAERLPTILPPLQKWQQLEVTALHSVAGALDTTDTLVQHPPFVAPHHSATVAALVGGGAVPKPGAISLAHHGVLFLDEITLMRPAVLDALRMPMENGVVVHLRTHHRVTFPARTQLVMATNPCRCGAAYASECTCSSSERAKHGRALSGPLRDRMDLNVTLSPAGAKLGVENKSRNEPSAAVRDRVQAARDRACRRWQALGLADEAAVTNASVPRSLLRRHAGLDEEAMALLDFQLRNGEITQRGVDRVIAVAWTLADLQGIDAFTFEHVQRACQLHASEGG